MPRWAENIRLREPLADVRLHVRGQVPPELTAMLRSWEETSYQRGRADAEESLRQQLVEQRAELSTLQQGVLASLAQAVPRVAAEAETVLIELAVETARKLVAGLPTSVEMVAASVREALERVREGTKCVVHLHPEDLELLKRADPPLWNSEADRERIRFQSSAEVGRGGCLVHTQFGVIDGRRETKVEMLRQELLPT